MRVTIFAPLALAVLHCASLNAQSMSDVEGFVEPFRMIDVASAETGRIDSVLVTIGQRVEKGDPVAQLDDALQRALVDIAEQQASAIGAIEAAKADRAMHEMRIQKLEKLTAGGYARPEELFRARSEFAVSVARVRQAEESQLVNEAELRRYRVQLGRRRVTAPASGIVSDVMRDPGEFVSPSDPYVVRMIQVDPLLAVFNLSNAGDYTKGTKVSVRIGEADLVREGVVYSVSPMINAESGTTQVRIQISNSDHQLKAGAKCWLPSSTSDDPDAKQARRPSRRLISPLK